MHLPHPCTNLQRPRKFSDQTVWQLGSDYKQQLCCCCKSIRTPSIEIGKNATKHYTCEQIACVRIIQICVNHIAYKSRARTCAWLKPSKNCAKARQKKSGASWKN